MDEQKFKLKYALAFLILIFTVSIFNYMLINTEVQEYLPSSWGDPIEISKGDISKDIGVQYLNNEYIISHIDGENLSVVKISNTGDILKKSSIPLETKFIKNIDVFSDSESIILSFTQRTKGVDSLNVIKLNSKLEVIEQHKLNAVKIASQLQDSIYALANSNSISIIDISTMDIISSVETSTIVQMDAVKIGNTSYVIYSDTDQNFYSIAYDNGTILPEEKIMQITSIGTKIEDLRTLESNGDLLIIQKHIDMSFNSVNTDLGDFIYRHSLANKTTSEPYSVNEALIDVGVFPVSSKIVKGNDNMKLLVIIKDKIGSQTTSENILGFTINTDNSLVPLGTINSFVKYYDYGAIEHEAVFYAEYEKHGSKILKMTSQNEDYINKGLEDTSYERKIVNGLFGDRYITSIIMMLFTFVILGFIYGIAMVAHMILNSKFTDQKGTILIIGVSLFAFLGKLIVFNSIFYGRNIMFLSPLLQPFWKCIVINLIISLGTTLWNLRYYYKNDLDISYPEMFALFFLDGFISLLIFYPSIF